MVQSQGMTCRALLAIGSYDVNVTEWFGGAHQTAETVREDPVIVRAEKSHDPR